MEIATLDEILMMAGAAGIERLTMPELGSVCGLSEVVGDSEAAGKAAASDGALKEAHKLLAGLMSRGWLVPQNGRAVLAGDMACFFHCIKNASHMLCVLPREQDYMPAWGWISRDLTGIARLEGVAAQPGAFRLQYTTPQDWCMAFCQWLSRDFFDISGKHREDSETETFHIETEPFDGYFIPGEMLMIQSKIKWLWDICPAGRPEDVNRRLMLAEEGAEHVLVYEEGTCRERMPGNARLFQIYFKRLLGGG